MINNGHPKTKHDALLIVVAHISIMVLLSESALQTTNNIIVISLFYIWSNYFDYRYRDILDNLDEFLVNVEIKF